MDSTKIETTQSCYRGKVHKEATKGYGSTGEFRGFKLHVLINENNQICNFLITSANVHDLNPIKNNFLDGNWKYW